MITRFAADLPSCNVPTVSGALEKVSEARDTTVLVHGTRLHYRVAGTGPALILLHGLVGSGRNWIKNLDFLAQYRTVYALDLANCGVSDRVPGLDASLEAHAERVAGFMDAVGIEVADLAGHSHGAAMAMLTAARHPRRVRRLVLFAPANPFCTLGRKQMRFYATPFGAVFASRVIPLLPRALHLKSLARMYGDPGRIGEGVLEGYTCTLDRWGITNILEIMLRWREDMAVLEAALPAVAKFRPLLIWGDRDRAVSIDSGRELARRLGAPLRIVPDAGHIAFEEMPQVCNAVMAEWLAS